MQLGSELSKTVATFIVQKILLDQVTTLGLLMHVQCSICTASGDEGFRLLHSFTNTLMELYCIRIEFLLFVNGLLHAVRC